jgi:hypothetical protein
LDQPAEHNLSDGFAMLLSNREQSIIIEKIVSPFRKRSPGLNLHLVVL